MKKKINFIAPQLIFVINLLKNLINDATLIWGRGTGKSFIIAWLMHTIIRFLPRSTWLIVGETLKQLLTVTLPGTFEALMYLGYREHRDDKHPGDFVIRKKPPAYFESPIRPCLDYNNMITFRNGTSFYLVSLDGGAGSPRGFNSDGILEDEALLNNKDKLDSEVYSTNRGNLGKFKSPLHHGVLRFSSMPHGEQGAHLLKQADYYRDDKFDFEKITNEIAVLQVEFIRTSDRSERKRLWKEIYELNKKLRWYAKGKRFYSQANTFDNIENLGIKFIEKLYREMSDFAFQIEVLNIRQKKLEGGFYPLLKESVHGYRLKSDNDYLDSLDYDFRTVSENSRMDADCDPDIPLRLAVDWGSRINCLSVAQQINGEYRMLKDFYVKEVEDMTQLEKLAQDFCEYYAEHRYRGIRFIKDVAYGNRRQPNSTLTFNQQFVKILRANGWQVTEIDLGVPKADPLRYLLWQIILSENERSKWRFRINLDNCKHTFYSMSNTPVIDGKNGIEKDKSSEKSKVIPQEDASHFSDVVDQHVLSIAKDLLNGQASASSWRPWMMSGA
ncbi:hypothetical protein FUAX_55650 (plasmid) [Fulvitalea axinellae]|uniref:Phage terminase large subunit N-terminal domain-containing protein n=1 Tax=Fulvitalea axinellae TaxID=1182444 RepID=A0AAU9DB61_9BACT|nr:hypothetical protein FUAX_55650 [Fulvitalea axinellae]